MSYMFNHFVIEIGQSKQPIIVDADLKSMLEQEDISDDISFLFTKNMAVKDVHRYDVEITKDNDLITTELSHNDDTGFPCSRYMDLKPPENTKSMVLVLESPHIDEFSGVLSSAKPIAPAQSTTGRNIEQHILKHIEFAIRIKPIVADKYP